MMNFRFRRKGLVLFFLLLSLFLTACHSQSGSTAVSQAQANKDMIHRAKIRIELGTDYYKRGNYSVAIKELEQAKRIYPDLPDIYSVLGLIYMDIGKYKEAESNFLRGLELAPNSSDLHNNYGWYLCQTQREKDAFPHFVHTISDPLYPTPSKPLHNAGICSRRLGNASDAFFYFSQALQVDPNDFISLYNLAEMNLEEGSAASISQSKVFLNRLFSLTSKTITSQIIWLGIRLARAENDKFKENSLSVRLFRDFPESSEAIQLKKERFRSLNKS